jgi:hypothetical protein
MCPRLGDSHTRTELADRIKQVCPSKYSKLASVTSRAYAQEVTNMHVIKAESRHQSLLNLRGCKLTAIPKEIKQSDALSSLTDLNLSRNFLFSGTQVAYVSM